LKPAAFVRKLLACASAAVAAAASCGSALADDADTGRSKAQVCTVCHGPLGVSVAPDAPNLAGQPALYLSAQLRAYRDGTRKHEVMSLMARPLTNEDIAHLAAWFSSIRVEATSAR
jgi:cytochrome c553